MMLLLQNSHSRVHCPGLNAYELVGVIERLIRLQKCLGPLELLIKAVRNRLEYLEEAP